MIFLYRKSGGQVLGATVDVSAYAGIDATYFATVTDPPQSNGADLSVPKIYDLTNLRDATVPEQAAFVTAAASDLNLQQRAAAINRLQTDPVLRKILRAIVGSTLTAINPVRQNPTTTFAAISQAQAETAILAAINAGTFD